MAECKECLYYEVCADFRRNICETDQRRFEEYKINSNGICDNFKNKSEVVEVVRCKHCSYRKTHICAITGAQTLFCDYWDKPYPIEEEHYCGYGTRTPQKEG